MGMCDTGMINLITNREVKETSVCNFALALKKNIGVLI